jgi:hypothetical protein
VRIEKNESRRDAETQRRQTGKIAGHRDGVLRVSAPPRDDFFSSGFSFGCGFAAAQAFRVFRGSMQLNL